MELLPLAAIMGTVIGAVWGHAIWLSSRFGAIYNAIDVKFEKILSTLTEKLEYHEQHDDRRFGDITNNLWELRLQQAIKEGKFLAIEPKKEIS